MKVSGQQSFIIQRQNGKVVHIDAQKWSYTRYYFSIDKRTKSFVVCLNISGRICDEEHQNSLKYSKAQEVQ